MVAQTMMVGVRRRWGGGEERRGEERRREERRGEERRDVMLVMLVEQLVSRLLVLEFGVLGVFDQSGVWNHLMFWTMTLSPVMPISEDYVTVKTLIKCMDSRSHLQQPCQWTELKLSDAAVEYISKMPSPGAPDPEVKNGCAGGEGRGGGRDGREVAEGQTGDAESQGKQPHKDRHGAEERGGTGEVLEGLTLPPSHQWSILSVNDLALRVLGGGPSISEPRAFGRKRNSMESLKIALCSLCSDPLTSGSQSTMHPHLELCYQYCGFSLVASNSSSAAAKPLVSDVTSGCWVGPPGSERGHDGHQVSSLHATVLLCHLPAQTLAEVAGRRGHKDRSEKWEESKG
ncbi:hypothetical protein INR49_026158 [Caranx melampygus]|nr:hypothetical protein INR49_026158 [Caranx melampygus]